MVEPDRRPWLPDELGTVDCLLHRGEVNPRIRSGVMALELLDTTPDWDRFRTRFENASRKVLRLRQEVVVPTLPTASPRWVVDPDFNLDFHVRRLRVSEPGTLRQVFDLAELVLQSPLDILRPMWTATLVEGLLDGQAATLLHISHAVTDGVGGVEMFAEIYYLERDLPAKPTPPVPVPQDLSPDDLMRQGLNRLPLNIVGGVAVAVAGAVSGIVDYAVSGVRVINRAAEPSLLLRRRSLTSRTEAIDIRLFDLHKAAKAGGGSINDTYLAGLSGALRRYHHALGVSISTLPMAVPVSLRADADTTGGNRFTGVNLAAPLGTADPVSRMKKMRAQMTQRRDEPAMNIIGALAPMLASVLEGINGLDVQASNVPVYPGYTYIAGAKVLWQCGIGPLPGVAMMVVLISRGGWCTITVRYDRAAVREEALFARYLLEGFDEILALAGDPPPRAVPASFTDQTDAASRLVSSS
ncbi:wax ester/triacylglycerol synthase family O-acyltransferase [Mycobacterium tilburgii]|uniref:wax ester/triacylglycerol synthase family O-acyltransferase n=1 Tax=Mycobacterium tilburgii TaxID=44467 RepID=UPI00118468AA|nr:wax ester/triacylglycerol synthase family O-acyltransferase [Mycobacterium tilburgii]